jgi:16S rRNA processing protein RimM
LRKSNIDDGGAASTTAAPALVALGDVVNTHGIRGEVRVRLYNPASTTLRPGAQVVLRRARTQQTWRVVALRPHQRVLLMQFEGCDSMTAAEALVGCAVCVHETDLPPLAAHEIYYRDLRGMTVVTTGGVCLGVIEEIIPTGSTDVCVVRGEGHEHLIPLIADVVRELDRAGRRLVIEPLPGLLEPGE